MSAEDDCEADIALFLEPADQWPTFNAYRPLDRNTSETRLLTLSHDNHSGLMDISIHHFSLTSPGLPDYEAISYCWGPPDRLVMILIDGEEVLIRNSLYQMLLVICTESHPSYLWLDSICINQFDVEEQSWQVALMSQIYSKAARVNVWLGPSSGNSDYVFSYMKCHDDVRMQNLSSKTEIRHRVQKYLTGIFAREYWTRLWVIQEFALARSVTLWCGRRHLPWDVFCDIVKENFNSNIIDRFWALREKTIKKKSIHVLVLKWLEQACTDRRDKIYSLLGLASNGDLITIDCSKSALEIFLDLCSTLMLYNGATYAVRSVSDFSVNTRNDEGHSLHILQDSILELETERPQYMSSLLTIMSSTCRDQMHWKQSKEIFEALKPEDTGAIRLNYMLPLRSTKSDRYPRNPAHSDCDSVCHYLNPSHCDCTWACTADSTFIALPGIETVPRDGDLSIALQIDRDWYALVFRPEESMNGSITSFIGVIPMIYPYKQPNGGIIIHEIDKNKVAKVLVQEICLCRVVQAWKHPESEEWEGGSLSFHISRAFWFLLLMFPQLCGSPVMEDWVDAIRDWRSKNPMPDLCQCTIQSHNKGHIVGTKLLEQTFRIAKETCHPREHGSVAGRPHVEPPNMEVLFAAAQERDRKAREDFNRQCMESSTRTGSLQVM